MGAGCALWMCRPLLSGNVGWARDRRGLAASACGADVCLTRREASAVPCAQDGWANGWGATGGDEGGGVRIAFCLVPRLLPLRWFTLACSSRRVRTSITTPPPTFHRLRSWPSGVHVGSLHVQALGAAQRRAHGGSPAGTSGVPCSGLFHASLVAAPQPCAIRHTVPSLGMNPM